MKEHPNKDILLLKLRELRREEIPLSARHILDSVEKLVKNDHEPPTAPAEEWDTLSIAQNKRRKRERSSKA